jgi:DNA repair exonuclease SbcCD nuclease subunit
MTFEQALATLAINTGRIAEALEALVGAQGIVPGADTPKPTKEKATKPPAQKELLDDDDDDEPVVEKPKNKKASKKKGKTTVVGKEKKDDDDAPKLTIKDDVRPVLKRLRDEVSHAAVKSLLKKYNVSTIQQLKEKDYPRIIADAEEDLE